ncbi:endoplasmic reticulum metallopeptidase 1 [Thecamonas trahens ATCC 50062]|uniref:Endoplasmic reticulum metallopeptidase 1 n=1 Tax=Thecamonas trahens ATCC 50062 TaxID=461836 RepID=A0A0L0DT60_THETB|nr:endoplasmic reticulum metallopeptidase 1 [Thecamonas trahens ATCC 50062]KNC55412.1 endoplasmic reticulum metallopeptidase 1 [Thecamonas trahens ATCC 50062]|eukprot:XP_013752951.1 endoplasmic reticulum metallopeptidase 1 [Thecamonas trahens ATCC 50062]
MRLATDGLLAVVFTVVLAALLVARSSTLLPSPLPMFNFPAAPTHDALDGRSSSPASVPWSQARFSEGNARVHLHAMALLGPKLLGSDAAEVHTQAYILSALTNMASSPRLSPRIKMEVEVQVASGSFFLDFISGFASVYHNVSNVLVRLSLADGENDAPGFLLSTHYDSALHSPAASDALAGVSILLETVRVISEYPDEVAESGILSAPLVVNLNGAEESLLQGAHAFITQHRWGSNLRGFLNIEAAGSGGREIVFQTGPRAGWLALSYLHGAPHPYANSMAQDIFQSGIIPSDTDFRIYRDYGELPGIDMAFVANGYVYHTPLDQEVFVTQGSLQHAGDNVLGTLLALGAEFPSPAEQAPWDAESLVFFDVLGLMTVAYTLRSAELLHSALAALWLALIAAKLGAPSTGKLRHIARDVMALAGMMLGTMLAPAVVGSVLALGAPLFGHTMAWFASQWLLVVLFVPAALAANVVLAAALFGSERRYAVAGRASGLDIMRGVWVVLLLGLTFGHKGSSFFPALWVAGLVAPAVALAIPAVARVCERSPLGYLALHLAALVPALVVALVQILGLFEFFVPLMARIGTAAPSDVVMGVAVGAPVAVIGSVFTLLVLEARGMEAAPVGRAYPEARKRATVSAAAVVCVLVCVTLVGVLLVPRISPYTELRPKRVFAQHVLGDDADGPGSALWLNVMDYNSIGWLLGTSAGLAEYAAKAETLVCPAGRVYCAPWYLPIADMVTGGQVVPVDSSNVPLLVNPELVRITSSAVEGGVAYVFRFPAATTHATLTVELPAEREIVEWSIADPLPARPANGAYFIYLTDAVGGSARPERDESQHVFEVRMVIAGAGGRLAVGVAFHSQALTPQLHAFEASLPPWVVPVSWVSQHVRRSVQ